MKQTNQPLNPFFAQFLESQTKDDAQSHGITKPWLDIQEETHKYPSDSDEGGDPGQSS